MGKFSSYAGKASPTTADKLLIDDVADGTTGTGLEKVITIGQLAKVVAGASSITVNASGDTTGATDTAAINTALSSFGGAGGVVTLGAGNYYLNAPLILPAGARLTGVAANTNDTSALGVTLNITSTWAQGAAPYGAAILCTGVDSAVDTINLNGGYPAFAVDGIWGSGNCVHVRDVSVYHGFTNGYVPAGVSWRMERCTASTCYQYGWWGVGTDNDYIDCIANANTSHGWYIKNPINTHLIGCRSEWNTGGYGFYVTGDGTGTGGGSLVSCSTDRNAQHGLYVDSTGTWPLLVSGMTFRRDGSSGGSYGAVTVAAACTSPVILDGITVFPGFNDDGSGTDTPLTGITVTAGATYVSVDNAMIHAVTTPVSGTITQVGGNVGTRTGAWNSPSAVTMLTEGPLGGLLVKPSSGYANGTFVGPGDANQYSNFNLADGVYPLDAAGHYWAFSHRKLPVSHSLTVFNYNGSTYLNVLTLTEAGAVSTPNSTLDDSTGNMSLAGGVATKVRTITTSGAVSATDSLVLLNAATLTATLPTAVGITGRIYTVKLITASTGTVATTSAQTIDGAASYSLTANHKYVTVVSDGANWQITANN